jgi:tRNA (mo5U34)-methyltransferase
MSEEEQRKTHWMVFESYNDFINPADKSLTVEGYAAPHRIFLSARK